MKHGLVVTFIVLVLTNVSLEVWMFVKEIIKIFRKKKDSKPSINQVHPISKQTEVAQEDIQAIGNEDPEQIRTMPNKLEIFDGLESDPSSNRVLSG